MKTPSCLHAHSLWTRLSVVYRRMRDTRYKRKFNLEKIVRMISNFNESAQFSVNFIFVLAEINGKVEHVN